MSISHRTHRLRLDGSPAVQKLHGDRYRLTFKLKSTNPREDWYNSNKDSIFADYGTLQSDTFDDNGAEARTGEAYANMLLVNASSQSQGEDYGVTFVYETLTASFVRESEDKVDFDLNGLKRVVKTIVAKSGTTYSNTLGTTPLSSDDESSDNDVILAKSEDYQLKSEEGGFRRITETYLEKGIISSEVKTKYGGNAETAANDFKIAEIKAVGLTAAEALEASSLSGFTLLDSAEENAEGLSVFIHRYTKGSGEISRTTSTEGLITNVVITSINATPEATDLGVVTKTDVQAREDAIIYTYTFSSGSGTLETKTSKKFDDQLTITTVRALNEAPDVPTGAYQISSSSESSGVFQIHTITYAEGTGLISESDTSKVLVESGLSGQVTENRQRWLNPTSSSYSADTDYVVVGETATAGDYGETVEYISIKGTGILRSSSETRSDGSEVFTVVCAGSTDPTTEITGTVGTDIFLVSEDINAQAGYEIITYKYYSLPDDYEVAFTKSLRTADRIDWDVDRGAHIGEAGSMDSFTGKSEVKFSVEAPAETEVSDLEPSVVVNETVSWTDGTLSARNQVFRNAYANFVSKVDSGTGGEIYRGKAYTGYNVDVNGAETDPYSGNLVVGFEVVPYLSVGGVTIYKETTSSVNA